MTLKPFEPGRVATSHTLQLLGSFSGDAELGTHSYCSGTLGSPVFSLDKFLPVLAARPVLIFFCFQLGLRELEAGSSLV